MLRIDRVELEDFGPFKGRQAINLPEAPGVAVVYGENMRGKTVLLNAIRFALFGKVLGRARREGSLHTIGNWEQAAAGQVRIRGGPAVSGRRKPVQTHAILSAALGSRA